MFPGSVNAVGSVTAVGDISVGPLGLVCETVLSSWLSSLLPFPQAVCGC